MIAHIRENFAAAFFPRLSEWIAASMLLAIGVMLLLNPDQLQTPGVRAYGLMLSIMDQESWSNSYIAFSMVRLVVLLVNGALRRSPHLRALSAFLSCLPWTLLVLSFSQTFGFAFIMACGWLAMDMVNILRAMRDARTVDEFYARSPGSGHQ